MERHRTIMLVDMDAFFASVEQQCNPNLRGKPVLVGGHTIDRSIVSAASYEARKYGIHSAMPMREAIRLCPHAVIVPGSFSKYSHVSRRIFQICSDYTDQVEAYSVDECFLDLTDTQRLFEDAVNIGLEIKGRIHCELGLTCSIGIAPNKMLAKIACERRKPNGLSQILPEEVAEILERMPVEKLHGIGEKLRLRLARLGIKTAGELGRAPINRLLKEFGIIGRTLSEMGRGEYYSDIVAHHEKPEAKSVGHAHTLSENTRNWTLLAHHILRLSEMAGRRLRKHGYAGRTVTLTIRYSNMSTFSSQRSLPEYIDDGFAIYKAALEILETQKNKSRLPIRLVGVTVSNIAEGPQQLSLFIDKQTRALLCAMDAVNNRYGEFAVKRASLLNVKSRLKTNIMDAKEFDAQ